MPDGSKLLDGAQARCRHVKDRVDSKRDRRRCERSVYQGSGQREGERGGRQARADWEGRKQKGKARGGQLERGRERGRRRAGGAVELKGRKGAEIGRGRVPWSGNEESDAGFARARGYARRQGGRPRYPACGTEAWVWRCRPLATAEARQRRSSLVSKYTRVPRAGALAPSPRRPVAEWCVVMSRRLT